ncbi:MAG: hypothetical protein ACI85I_002730, partial [Arenicella sp.]
PLNTWVVKSGSRQKLTKALLSMWKCHFWIRNDEFENE